jgi:hypothetical protein
MSLRYIIILNTIKKEKVEFQVLTDVNTFCAVTSQLEISEEYTASIIRLEGGTQQK